MSGERYDILVVGAGCAGLTAALYAARAGRRVLVLESGAVGGQIASSPRVENYPGIPGTSGLAFADALCAQAMAFGAELDLAQVLSAVPDAEGFLARCDDGRSVACRSLILATGARHRALGLARENELSGVSYCAVCDGAFHKGEDVAVVGGGSAALQSAEYLAGVCRSVTLIHRRDSFRGEEALAARVRALPNVRLRLGRRVAALRGSQALTGVDLAPADRTQTGDSELLPVTALFASIGQTPDNGAFSSLVTLDAQGYICAEEDCRTSCPGVFAAGDCRTKAVRQLTTAAADGTVAALAACDYAQRG